MSPVSLMMISRRGSPNFWTATSGCTVRRLDLGTGSDRRVQFGNMLLSRYPILSSRMLLLPRVGTIDRTSIERCALEGVIDAPGGPLRVYSVHLDHLNSRHRLEQIRWLRHVVLLAASTGTTLTGPPWDLFGVPIMAVPTTDDCLLMGDFNMLPGSPEYDEMVGEPDYYQGRTLTTDRLADAWTSAGRGLDDGATWSDGDVFVKLDYIFVKLDYIFVKLDYIFVKLDYIFVKLDYIFVKLDYIFVKLDYIFVKLDYIFVKLDYIFVKLDYIFVKLDYIFVNGALAHRVRSPHVGDDAGGSDHDPLWVELDL